MKAPLPVSVGLGWFGAAIAAAGVPSMVVEGCQALPRAVLFNGQHKTGKEKTVLPTLYTRVCDRKRSVLQGGWSEAGMLKRSYVGSVREKEASVDCVH
jgi:hypothetical protein